MLYRQCLPVLRVSTAECRCASIDLWCAGSESDCLRVCCLNGGVSVCLGRLFWTWARHAQPAACLVSPLPTKRAPQLAWHRIKAALAFVSCLFLSK
ncbi:hypothetical protein ElyMa_003936300 [Elysia marginata]|uniref:WAP domain-containing protein n=1 Tax=Elysia marginata TaxID=1093978 RepID=A0AAV4FTH1_9GAST|nr:hypothetical protein ElyMa_003936300 [Elysia marginata]